MSECARLWSTVLQSRQRCVRRATIAECGSRCMRAPRSAFAVRFVLCYFSRHARSRGRTWLLLAAPVQCGTDDGACPQCSLCARCLFALAVR